MGRVLGLLLGDRLASARKRAGYSQRQLAGAMGGRYDQTMISHVESGRSGLVGDGLTKAAEVLKVSTDYLFGLTDYPTPADELAKSSGPNSPSFALVPEVAAIVGQGRGEAGYDATVLDRLPIPYKWLPQPEIDPDKYNLVTMKGDLMAPTIPDGCTFLVNKNSREFRDDTIFVLQFEQQVIETTLKYLTPARMALEKGVWDGKQYEDWYVQFDGNEEARWPLQIYNLKEVIGEVVMVVSHP